MFIHGSHKASYLAYIGPHTLNISNHLIFILPITTYHCIDVCLYSLLFLYACVCLYSLLLLPMQKLILYLDTKLWMYMPVWLSVVIVSKFLTFNYLHIKSEMHRRLPYLSKEWDISVDLLRRRNIIEKKYVINFECCYIFLLFWGGVFFTASI